MKNNPKIYECGTLRYTIGGVVIAAGLIMIGFFCMNFAMTAVNGAIPLRLKELGAGDTLIAFILTTIGGVFNITVCPAVSFKSDRYRGKRWGRRIVFIIGTLPMFCAAILLFGLSGRIGDMIAAMLSSWRQVAPATVTLVVIGVIMVMYQFFYMFVASVIYYLYNDVIPQQFLARVVGLVQVTTVGAGAIFNFFFFRYSLSHFSTLMAGAALVYAVGVGMMCLMLKEPRYPPLTEEEKRQSRGGTGIVTFVRESFSHPFYWYAFLGCAFWSASSAISTFLVFFFRDMGASLEDIGKINGIAGIVGMALSMMMATLGAVFIDRWHPMRVHTYARLFSIMGPLLNCKWLFFTISEQNFYWIYLIDEIIMLAVNYAMGISTLPMLMRAFPKSRFGQFCSAQAMLRSVTVLILGFLLGAAIDFGRQWIGNGEFIYRYLWVWRLFWGITGSYFILMMYREWKRLGGDTAYRAPAPWSPGKFEAMENSPVIGPAPKYVRLGVVLWDITVCLYIAGALTFAVVFEVYGLDCSVFLKWSLPLSLAAAILWITVRRKITARLNRRDMDKSPLKVPHHGLLILSAVQQLFLLAAAVIQSVLTAGESSTLSARFYFFELLICLAALLLIALSVRIERDCPDNAGSGDLNTKVSA